MRVITPAQQAVLDSGVQAEYVRFWVKDADGNWRDLTTWPGFNALKSVSWGANINDPCGTFDATLIREAYELSLSPFMRNSALNRGFDPTADYEPLLKINREVKIEVAIVPMDSQPQSGDWFEVFRGRIDQLNAARGRDITLNGRDMSGRLAQQYIKEERVYAYGTDGGNMVSMRVWRPELPVAVGDYIVPATRGEDDPGYNKFFKADTAGVTGIEEPTWSTGTNIADGTTQWDYVGAPDTGGFAVQDVIQKILNDNRLAGDPAITLYTPEDPLWDITEFLQQRGFTLDAVRALATQIGWDLRQKWRESASAFAFTLYEPEREEPEVLHEFEPGAYGEISKLAEDIAARRNSVRVIFKDRTDLWPDGTPKRKEVNASDPESIADLEQELWSEIQEDELSNIDTPAEAERFAAAFISDCAWPTVDAAIPLTRGFPWVELNDFYAFKPDGVHSSTDLELAVMSFTQSFDKGLQTKLELRGAPSIGHEVHIDKEFHPGKPAKNFAHRFTHFAAPTTANPNFREIVGGVFVDFKFPENTKKTNLLTEYEVHISDTDGFTPGENTLVGIINGTSQSIPYQNPNGPNGGDSSYYGCVVPRWFNSGQIVRGQPSARKEFKAGRASAGHLQQGPEWGRLPLNGGFETWNDTNTLPDHWFTTTGVTWGTNVQRVVGPDGVSGDSWIRLNVNFFTPVYLESDAFTIEKDTPYNVSWWANIFDAGTAGQVTLFVRWLDWEKELISEVTVDEIDFDEAGMTEGTWYRRGDSVMAPSDARFAQIFFRATSGGDMKLDVDSVRFERA